MNLFSSQSIIYGVILFLTTLLFIYNVIYRKEASRIEKSIGIALPPSIHTMMRTLNIFAFVLIVTTFFLLLWSYFTK